MTDWIENKFGLCPIPDAKAGEFELRRAHGCDALSTTDAIHLAWDKFDKYPSFTITHYRLLKPAVEWQAIADELASALKRIHPDPDIDDCVFAQEVSAKYQKAKGIS